MLYSANTGGFYDPSIHAVIPPDAVEISTDLHAVLLRGQAEGKRIIPGDKGLPVLVAAPEKSEDQLASEVRRTRALLLSESDWTQLSDAPLLPEEKDAWKEYRQKLRDISSQKDFPKSITWPKLPIF